MKPKLHFFFGGGLLMLGMLPATVLMQELINVEPPFEPIPPMSEYVPLDSTYPEDFRILDCWQCFQAKGKVCTESNYESMIKHV